MPLNALESNFRGSSDVTSCTIGRAFAVNWRPQSAAASCAAQPIEPDTLSGAEPHIGIGASEEKRTGGHWRAYPRSGQSRRSTPCVQDDGSHYQWAQNAPESQSDAMPTLAA